MCKLYAYCRVSTQKQDLQRQIDNICKRVKDGMAAKKNKAAAKGITVTYGAKQVIKLITKKSLSAS